MEGGNPFDAITGPLITALQGLAVPAAVIGITLAIIGFILIPLIPALQQQRGYIQMALLGVAVISFIPGIATYLFGLGGGAAPAHRVPANPPTMLVVAGQPATFAASQVAFELPAFEVSA